MNQTKTRYRDQRVHIVSSGHLLIAVWNDAPTMGQMRALERAGDAHRDELAGDKQAFANIALDGTPNFNDEVRAEAARHSQRSSPWRLATAHVLLFSGMRGIAVRSFLSTMILLGRPKVPTKVFDRIEASGQWLLPFLPATDAWTLERFLDLYHHARAQ